MTPQPRSEPPSPMGSDHAMGFHTHVRHPPPQAARSPLSPRRYGPLMKRSHSPLPFLALSLSPAPLLCLSLPLPMNHLDKHHRSRPVISYFDTPRGAPSLSYRPPSNSLECANAIAVRLCEHLTTDRPLRSISVHADASSGSLPTARTSLTSPTARTIASWIPQRRHPSAEAAPP
jgi:hypothetical protein